MVWGSSISLFLRASARKRKVIHAETRRRGEEVRREGAKTTTLVRDATLSPPVIPANAGAYGPARPATTHTNIHQRIHRSRHPPA